ncbi:MAG: hypothetical protein WCS99_14495 [Limisphaerales bacterium]
MKTRILTLFLAVMARIAAGEDATLKGYFEALAPVQTDAGRSV